MKVAVQDKRAESPPAKFAAFISYRHEGDEAFATRLQNGIERFATTRRQGRSVRVFRDDANLPASSDLWKTIEGALADSGWLILLASPESAASEWVGMELQEWRRLERRDRLLIVVTRGTLHWSKHVGDFDASRSTALNPALRGLLRSEPRIVRAHDVFEGPDRQERDRAMESVLADVVAAVRGVDKDTIRGEHLAIQRQALRRSRQVTAGLALLTVAALIAGGVAWWQRDVARTQAAVATARALAAEVDAVAPRDPALSVHLALAAYRLDPSAASMSALVRSVQGNANVGRFLEVGAGRVGRSFRDHEAQDIALAPDGRVVAVGGYGGQVRVWSTADGHLIGTYPTEDNGIAGAPISFSADGRRLATRSVVVSVPDGGVVYEAPGGLEIDRLATDGSAVVLSASVLSASVPDGWSLVELASGDRRPTPIPDQSLTPRFLSAAEVAYERIRPSVQTPYTALAADAGRWTSLQNGTSVSMYALVSGTLLARTDLPAAGHGDAIGMSADGSVVLVGDDFGTVTRYDGPLGAPTSVARLPGQIRDISLTPDGSTAAVTDSLGTATLLDLRRDGLLTELPGTSGRRAASEPDQPLLVPSPDGRLLLIADGRGSELWSLADQRPVGTLPFEPLDLVGSDPVAGFSADGSRLAFRGVAAVHVVKTDGLQEVEQRAPDSAQLIDALGGGADLTRSDRQSGNGPWRSPSGRLVVADGRVTDTTEGTDVPLSGGSGQGSSSSMAFAANDSVIVESVVPSRDSEVYRNRLQLWDSSSGTLLGAWDEPQSVTFAGDQAGDVVVAGGDTALTIRPDGGIGQWPVSPRAWAGRLCALVDEPGEQERRDRFALLEEQALCP